MFHRIQSVAFRVIDDADLIEILRQENRFIDPDSELENRLAGTAKQASPGECPFPFEEYNQDCNSN
jgi:hypothetical protein